MIIDTEPVRFSYADKNWLITFWKGQYGIVTGAEIGVYYTKQRKVNKRTVYFPVNDSEMLKMDFILYTDGSVITRAKAKHWWLAIFKLGMFSEPRDLVMDVNIRFLDREMLEAFVNSFKKLGYTTEDFWVIDDTFCFKYIKPRTRMVWTRMWAIDSIRQFFNRKNVELYNEYLDDLIEDNGIDDSRTINRKNLIMLNDFIPSLLKNNLAEDGNLNGSGKKIFDERENNIVFLDRDIHFKGVGRE